MSDTNANHCFGCGPANSIGLHLKFLVETSPTGEITASAPVQLSRLYEGGRNYLHGGIIATVMDEAMSKLNKPLGSGGMTRHIQIDYLRPAPVDTPLTISSRVLRQEGRKRFFAAELKNAAGELLAEAKALFIAIDPTKIETNSPTDNA